jgi:anti-sigma regulatory factor (Ser/Thr protein kinase)
MSHGGMTGRGHGHALSLYALERDGVQAVADFVVQGWEQDECVVLVATAAHLAAVEAHLVGRRLDLADRTAAGRYLVFDAEETLAGLLVDDHLDAAGFLARVEDVLAQASEAKVPIRAFGEMVALLWRQGRIEAAIELEQLWADVVREHAFLLLCAYPTDVFEQTGLIDVRRVCDLHTDLLPAQSPHPTGTAVDGAGQACSRVYLPSPESVPAARHFVVDVLRSWGHEALAADGALIVTELASNALRHAASPFRALVEQRPDGLRIGVEDALDVAVEPRNASADDLSGRGVAIVAALSERWGHRPVPGGKVVWADLPTDPDRSRAG